MTEDDKITIKAQEVAGCGKCGKYESLCKRFCCKSDQVEEFKKMAEFVVDETCKFMREYHLHYLNPDMGTETLIRHYKKTMEE